MYLIDFIHAQEPKAAKLNIFVYTFSVLINKKPDFWPLKIQISMPLFSSVLCNLTDP